MTERTVDDIVAEAARLFGLKHHCSEAIVIATGQFYLEPYPDLLTRASDTFGGGLGGCRDELCGLLSGATLILGALFGRVSYDEDDKWLYEVVKQYRERFIATNGTSVCRPLRDYYTADGGRCGPLVEDATRQLVELIEQVADERPEAASRLARRVQA